MRKEPDNFRKYGKTYRVLTPNIKVKGKHYYTSGNVKKLLTGNNIEITEKTDGANTGIFKNFDGSIYYQKRGSHMDNEHNQFVFFQQWAKTNYNKIQALPNGMVYYMELMRVEHSIYYDKLDDWCIMFKIWNMAKKRFLNYNEMKNICDKYNFVCANLIYKGQIKNELHLERLIPIKSKWGNISEGIVIFNPDNQMCGKVVKKEFVKKIEDDGDWHNKPIKYNKRKDNLIW